MDKRQ